MKPLEFINENKDNMLEDLRKLVSIPSVYDKSTASDDNPFGEEIGNALKCILSIGEKMGMQTCNIDGYAGEITAGEGEKLIGILGHIDVVAAGEGWKTNPFSMFSKEDKLYGRGTLDDKGALLASLYAMKYLKDEGKINKDSSVKMIIGTDEEEGWRCIEYYKQRVKRLPDYTIVPDANFPAVTCEKGLLDIDFKYRIPEEDNDVKVISLSGGTARNIVPSKASVKLKCNNEKVANDISVYLQKFEKISFEHQSDEIKITASGISSHAMSPEKGFNAISYLMQVLGKLAKFNDIENIYSTYNNYIGMAYYGEKFGCCFEDKLSGKLTFNVGTIQKEENTIVLSTSIRYPATVEEEKVMGNLHKTCEMAGIQMDIKSSMDALFVDSDSKFVQILIDSYRRITDDNQTAPLSMGGATYARSLPNAVAFGPLFPYEEEIAHEPNEFLSAGSLKTMTHIYIDALQSLIYATSL